MSRLNEVVGQALDQVLLPRQALGGLRRLVCGLVKDPTGREILRTREIGFHVIMMGGGYAVKLVWECDLRGLDAQVLTLPLALECFLLCITWGILAGRHDSEDVASSASVRAGRKHARWRLILSGLLPTASLDSI
jgi:hypothetical protein